MAKTKLPSHCSTRLAPIVRVVGTALKTMRPMTNSLGTIMCSKSKMRNPTLGVRNSIEMMPNVNANANSLVYKISSSFKVRPEVMKMTQTHKVFKISLFPT